MEKEEFLKIVYFDEGSASDYLEILNGGQKNQSEEKITEKNAKVMAELEAELGTGFDLLSFLRAKVAAKTSLQAEADVLKKIESTITKTILIDFLEKASKDKSHITSFDNCIAFPSNGSIAHLKMYAPYMIIAKNNDKEDYDFSRFDEALENGRGYYELLIVYEDKKHVLRFNIDAFRNNYGLSDLTKMKLTYLAIEVGVCTEESLKMEREFDLNAISNEHIITGDTLLNGEVIEPQQELKVYDVILAGVKIKDDK